MKIDLKNNILVSTIGGNLFALTGLIAMCFHVFGFICLIPSRVSKYFLLGLSIYFTIVLIPQMWAWLIAGIIFVIELLLKKRLKKTLINDNPLYYIIFYLGIIAELIVISIAVWLVAVCIFT